MVKTKFFFVCFLCLNFALAHSQTAGNVGINTSEPRKTLEVGGDVIISGDLNVLTFDSVNDGDEVDFIKQEASNSIVSLNLENSPSAALAYVQEYELTNMQQDWVRDFDTRIDATEFSIVVVSSYYNQSVLMDINQRNLFSIHESSAFILNNTWHLTADYPVANNVTGNATPGVWNITIVVYPRSLTKQFGTVTYPLGENTTGTAATPLLD